MINNCHVTLSNTCSDCLCAVASLFAPLSLTWPLLPPAGYPGFQTATYTSRSYAGITPGYTYQFPGNHSSLPVRSLGNTWPDWPTSQTCTWPHVSVLKPAMIQQEATVSLINVSGQFGFHITIHFFNPLRSQEEINCVVIINTK